MLKKKTKLIISLAYGILLAGFAGLTMAETFLIPSSSGTKAKEQNAFDFDDTTTVTTEVTEETEETTETEEKEDTTVSYKEYTYTVSGKKIPYCLVTVSLKKISDFRTRIATNSGENYGSNITESFSTLISESEEESGDEVLFAIDGDFPFWSGRKGYVVRNGTEYRSTKRSDSSGLDLAIFKDGTFLAYDEKNISFDTLMSMNSGCYQNWSFGPALLYDSQIAVTEDQDVSQTKSANQRVSMGYKDGTLYFLCSNTNDGKRGSNSVGLSLYNMAEIYKDLGCTLAYNFDGGGSANMYIKGYGSDNYYMKQSRALGDIVYVVNS